jgi:hypothetical protein
VEEYAFKNRGEYDLRMWSISMDANRVICIILGGIQLKKPDPLSHAAVQLSEGSTCHAMSMFYVDVRDSKYNSPGR